MQTYVLHETPQAAVQASEGRGFRLIAILAPNHRMGEVYYDTVPKGQPLPDGSCLVDVETRGEQRIFRTHEAEEFLRNQ